MADTVATKGTRNHMGEKPKLMSCAGTQTLQMAGMSSCALATYICRPVRTGFSAPSSDALKE
eukprot:scaffold495_cov243-Pinguiococcus_pyrenoidosus.AAC.33